MVVEESCKVTLAWVRNCISSVISEAKGEVFSTKRRVDDALAWVQLVSSSMGSCCVITLDFFKGGRSICV